MSLEGRVAIVTGAGGAIGRGISEHLAERGMAVAMLDADGSVVETAAGLAAGGRRVTGMTVDVGSESSVSDVFASVESALGAPWLLVNCAGVYASGPTVELTLADWERVLSVDLTGVFLSSRTALRSMLREGGGRIITVSSIAGHIARPNQIAYCAAKAGAEHFTRCLAIEVAKDGVTVNTVAPGMTESAMLDMVMERVGGPEPLVGLIPSGRFAQPADHAATVAWLASDEAAHVTGQTISVDGAQSLYAPLTTGSDRATERSRA